ncbi:MAG: hypothetical protein QXL15_00255, partial [Candidatus Korarchaeota archaeon]
LESFMRIRESCEISPGLLENNSPVVRLTNSTPQPRYYLVHGYNDSIISVEHALQFEMRASALNLSINVTLLNNTGHDVYRSQDYFESVSRIFNETIGISIDDTSIYQDIFMARVFVTFGIGGMAIIFPFVMISPGRRTQNKEHEIIGFANFFVFLVLTSVSSAISGYLVSGSSYLNGILIWFAVLTCVCLITFFVAYVLEEKYIYSKGDLSRKESKAIKESKLGKRKVTLKNVIKKLKEERTNEIRAFLNIKSIIPLVISLGILGFYNLVMYLGASPFLLAFDIGILLLIIFISFVMLLVTEIWQRIMFQARVKHEIIWPFLLQLVFFIFMPHYLFYTLSFNTVFSYLVWPWAAGMIVVFRNSRSITNSALYLLPLSVLILTTSLHC